MRKIFLQNYFRNQNEHENTCIYQKLLFSDLDDFSIYRKSLNSENFISHSLFFEKINIIKIKIKIFRKSLD